MAAIGELRSKIFKNVPGISRASEQDDRPACASPVENFDPYSIAHIYETNLWLRRFGSQASRNEKTSHQRLLHRQIIHKLEGSRTA
jgi:hypothetical protein